jgi:hypothetical protein
VQRQITVNFHELKNKFDEVVFSTTIKVLIYKEHLTNYIYNLLKPIQSLICPKNKVKKTNFPTQSLNPYIQNNINPIPNIDKTIKTRGHRKLHNQGKV